MPHRRPLLNPALERQARNRLFRDPSTPEDQGEDRFTDPLQTEPARAAQLRRFLQAAEASPDTTLPPASSLFKPTFASNLNAALQGGLRGAKTVAQGKSAEEARALEQRKTDLLERQVATGERQAATQERVAESSIAAQAFTMFQEINKIPGVPQMLDAQGVTGPQAIAAITSALGSGLARPEDQEILNFIGQGLNYANLSEEVLSYANQLAASNPDTPFSEHVAKAATDLLKARDPVARAKLEQKRLDLELKLLDEQIETQRFSRGQEAERTDLSREELALRREQLGAQTLERADAAVQTALDGLSRYIAMAFDRQEGDADGLAQILSQLNPTEAQGVLADASRRGDPDKVKEWVPLIREQLQRLEDAKAKQASLTPPEDRPATEEVTREDAEAFLGIEGGEGEGGEEGTGTARTTRPKAQSLVSNPLGAAAEIVTRPVREGLSGVARGVGEGTTAALGGSPRDLVIGAVSQVDSVFSGDASPDQVASNLAEVIKIPGPDGEPLSSDEVYETLRRGLVKARQEGREKEAVREILGLTLTDEEMEDLEVSAKRGLALESFTNRIAKARAGGDRKGVAEALRRLQAHGIDSLEAFNRLYPQALLDLFRE